MSDATRHVVEITLGHMPGESMVRLDGELLTNVVRLALMTDIGDSHAATLTLTRYAARTTYGEQDEHTTDTTAMAIRGAVELIEEAARESLAALPLNANGNALHAFLIRTSPDERATTLGELVTDAERYRALRRYVGECAAGTEFLFTDADAMDRTSDELRAEHAHAGDGEPRRPVP